MAKSSPLITTVSSTVSYRPLLTRRIPQRCLCTTSSRPKPSHHNLLVFTIRNPITSSQSSNTTSLHGPRQCRYASAMPRPRNKVNSGKLNRHINKDMGPSMLTEQKRIGAGGTVGDYGLLPGTLIMPTGSKLPSASTMLYYRLQWTRLKKRLKDFATVFMYKWRATKPRPKLRLRQTAATGQALHHELFTAFAEANTTPLTTLAADGLRQNLLSRLASRPAHAAYKWTVHRYTAGPRVVSHRAAELPVPDGLERTSAVRQAVVRVRSVQSLRRVDTRTGRAVDDAGEISGVGTGLDYTPTGAAGLVVDGRGEGTVSARTLAKQSEGASAGGLNMNASLNKPKDGRGEVGEEREITEYVVLQKRVWRGEEGKWKIWGTVEESTQEEIDEISNTTEKRGGGVWERMKQAVSSSPAVGSTGMP